MVDSPSHHSGGLACASPAMPLTVEARSDKSARNVLAARTPGEATVPPPAYVVQSLSKQFGKEPLVARRGAPTPFMHVRPDGIFRGLRVAARLAPACGDGCRAVRGATRKPWLRACRQSHHERCGGQVRGNCTELGRVNVNDRPTVLALELAECCLSYRPPVRMNQIDGSGVTNDVAIPNVNFMNSRPRTWIRSGLACTC